MALLLFSLYEKTLSKVIFTAMAAAASGSTSARYFCISANAAPFLPCAPAAPPLRCAPALPCAPAFP